MGWRETRARARALRPAPHRHTRASHLPRQSHQREHALPWLLGRTQSTALKAAQPETEAGWRGPSSRHRHNQTGSENSLNRSTPDPGHWRLRVGPNEPHTGPASRARHTHKAHGHTHPHAHTARCATAPVDGREPPKPPTSCHADGRAPVQATDDPDLALRLHPVSGAVLP